MMSSSSDATAAAIDFESEEPLMKKDDPLLTSEEPQPKSEKGEGRAPAEEGRAPAEEEGQHKLSQLEVPQVARDQDVVEAKFAAMCLWFASDEAAEGQAAPAAQASAAELDAASSEIEKQAVAEKSEVLEAEGQAAPAAQTPVAELDAASSKSAEEIRVEAKPRLDVCFQFAALLLYCSFMCVLFLFISNAQEAPEAAAEADCSPCRCAPIPLRARRCRDDSSTDCRDDSATDEYEASLASSRLLEG
jgi:hypothetical protein